MKRTFIAFDIPPAEPVKEVFQSVQHKLRNERISWTNPDRLHVTLKFLGDTEEQQIPLIRQKLAEVVLHFHPQVITLAGLGVFRNIHDPHVLWIGCRIEDQMASLVKKIDDAMSQVGFQRESKPFSPHITMGRIKMIRQTNQLSEILASFKDRKFQEFKVKEIVFYESRLSAAGAIYTSIDKFIIHPAQS